MSGRLPRAYISGNSVREERLADNFDVSVLFGEYRDEAQTQLELLDAALLRIEREGSLDEEERDELLRALHTLKGNSGMVGLTEIRDYVHALESVFKSPPQRWPQPALDRLFEGAAALRRATEQVGTEDQQPAAARLAALAPPAVPETVEPDAALPAAPPAPPAPSATPSDETESTRAAPDREPSESEPSAPEPSAPTGAGEVLRVPFFKLDALLNQVTELMAVGSTLRDLAAMHREALDAAELRRPLIDQLEALGRTTTGLRNTAMELRLVPVRVVFGRFPSLARDLAREQEKRVRVILEGEDTELDKSTVDVLGEPLLHLVRNAVDHGIGTPEERAARGKPEEGTLVLRALQTGDQVRIEVEDDGRGLDRERIGERAREAGLIDGDAELSPEEVAMLIFRPGFSTREEASTVSGRGIGLDVVQRKVNDLGGRIEVEDAPSGGTRFILRLPLTLAILPVLLFESAGQTLAIAATEVEETTRDWLHEWVGKTEVVRHRDELIPLARPAALFGWQDGTGKGDSVPDEPEGFLVVVRRGERAAAIMADRLLAQREVVVKALPEYLGQPKGVSGATVAPDGRVVLLLDAGEMLELNLESHRRKRFGR